MKQLQLIYDEVIEKSEEVRSFNREVKRELDGNVEYRSLGDDIRDIKEKRALIRLSVLEKFGIQTERIGEVISQIKDEKQKMTDVAMTNLMKGLTVLVKDKYEDEYEPVWSVKFKKIS